MFAAALFLLGFVLPFIGGVFLLLGLLLVTIHVATRLFKLIYR